MKIKERGTNMKCPNCGCEDFSSAGWLETDSNALEGGSLQIMMNGRPVNAYVCKNCGRIELFVKPQGEKPEKKSGFPVY